MDPAVESALIGAAAALIGVGGTVIVAITGARNTRQTNQATIGAAREAQFAERYSRAIEQIGSDKLDIRIGGIYALEGIALDSARDHPTVIEVLSTFIREHPRSPPEASRSERGPPTDVQRALTVIGRRRAEHDIRRTDLSRAYLRGADLYRANLANVDLSYADLAGARLSGANLVGAALDNADLTGADLTGADLSGAAVIMDLVRAGGCGISLNDVRRFQAHLNNADFTNANLEGAWWPDSAPVPRGWELATLSRLTREPGY